MVYTPFTDVSMAMAMVMDESKLQPISVLCICSLYTYYCGEDTEETGERHQVIMLGQHPGHRTRAYGGRW